MIGYYTDPHIFPTPSLILTTTPISGLRGAGLKVTVMCSCLALGLFCGGSQGGGWWILKLDSPGWGLSGPSFPRHVVDGNQCLCRLQFPHSVAQELAGIACAKHLVCCRLFTFLAFPIVLSTLRGKMTYFLPLCKHSSAQRGSSVNLVYWRENQEW